MINKNKVEQFEKLIRQNINKDSNFINTLRKYNNALSLIDSIKLYFADFLMWYRAKETYNKQTNKYLST